MVEDIANVLLSGLTRAACRKDLDSVPQADHEEFGRVVNGVRHSGRAQLDHSHSGQEGSVADLNDRLIESRND